MPFAKHDDPTGVSLLPRPRHLDLRHRLVAPTIVDERIDPDLPSQGNAVDIDLDGVRVRAADPAGRFYAHATLRQLAHLHDGRVPVGIVFDHPDLLVRGVMLDVSRDKVPTLATIWWAPIALARSSAEAMICDPIPRPGGLASRAFISGNSPMISRTTLYFDRWNTVTRPHGMESFQATRYVASPRFCIWNRSS
jgi:hypothetical protein